MGRGDLAVTKDALPWIAEQFGVYEPLLAEFLLPAVFPTAVVRTNQAGLLAPGESGDWLELSDLLGYPDPSLDEGVQYHVPKRSLACSDVSIAWLVLDSGHITPVHAHPGWELLVPLDGQLTVEFPGKESSASVTSASDRILIFRSDSDHVVCNTTTRPANVLVLRCYEARS